MKSFPLKRIHNQQLSLWQSVVAQHALNSKQAGSQESKSIKASSIQDHPMIAATNHFIDRTFEEEAEELKSQPKLNSSDSQADLNSQLSHLCYNIAQAKVKGDADLEASLTASYRKFSDKDPGFITCATTYAKYYALYRGVLKYNSWQDNGGLNYGVIDYKLPNDAKVAVIGDWGTGMEDAACLLQTLLNTHQPDVIVHLGDIYYSGTPDECAANYSQIFDTAFQKYGKRLPVFTIPGNHDYYAFGYGYYEMVTAMNSFLPAAVQEASYFCLRTEDNGWQFLGMDTGYNDANPADQFNTYYAGPQLNASEITWHKDKLDNFEGATLLFSHHQMYSHHAKLNGSLSSYGSYPNLNKYLLDVFRPYFNGKVAGWMWGHEHNQVIYQDGLYGLPKGRLTGASAFEEMTSENPYTVNYPNVPIQSQYQLGNSYGYYNHGYAIIDLSVRQNPTDPVEISYYEYPSWGEPSPTPNPIPSTPTFMMKESVAPVPVQTGAQLEYGQTVQFNSEGGLDYIGGFTKGIQYYPSVTQKPVGLMISGGSGFIKSGDIIQISSLESGLGNYNTLGAWSTPALYYYTPGYSQQNWIIKKVNGADGDVIYETDAVYFLNSYYSGQYMCPFIQVKSPGVVSLSTAANVPAVWYVKKV